MWPGLFPLEVGSLALAANAMALDQCNYEKQVIILPSSTMKAVVVHTLHSYFCNF